MYRDAGCPECQKLTGGDCGMHGPRFIPLGSPLVTVTQCLNCERLKAEVERLQKEVVMWNNKLDNAEERVVKLERENVRLKAALDEARTTLRDYSLIQTARE